MSFFNAIDPRTIVALPLGSLVRVTYDETGARRANRYHTIEGVVTLVTDDGTRGLRVTLSQVTRTRPDGEVLTRDGLVIDGRRVMTLDVLETLAF